MRKSLAYTPLKQVLIHASYIMDQILQGFIIVVCIIAALQSLVTIASLPYVEAIRAGTMMTFIGILLYITFQTTTLVDELNRGDTMVYLSHALTRRAYLASWLIALCLVPVVVFVLSLLIPVAIIVPSLLGREMVLELAIYSALHIAVFSSIVVLCALSKRKGVVTIIGIVMTLLLPIVLSVVAYYYPLLSMPIGILCPFYYYTMYKSLFVYSHNIYVPPAIVGIASFIVMSAIIWLALAKVKSIDI